MIKAEVNADFAFSNNGSFRADIPPGDITTVKSNFPCKNSPTLAGRG
ncbi:MAG: 5'-nucleotidase C-terminal domain-containing protein [Peptococcaceae bacterium]|nr:5'-nucleotidase C-terminal domain-containing protein [Peptococcaceae bacterium]